MLSTAARRPPSFLRVLPTTIFRWTFPRTQTKFTTLRHFSTPNNALPSLENILKPRVQQKAEGTGTTTTPAPITSPSSELTLFIGGLPRWEVQTLEEKLGTIFSVFGEISAIRVGAHANGRKYAHVEYKTLDAAQEALRILKEVPVSIGTHTGQTLTVNPSGKRAVDPTRISSLFFKGFSGNRDILEKALKLNGYNASSIHLFLGSQDGGGRIDFPSSIDIHEAFNTLNGIEIGEGILLNLFYKDKPTVSPRKDKKPALDTTTAVPQTNVPAGRITPTPSQPRAPIDPLPAPTLAQRMKVLRVGNLPPQIPEAELEATVRQFLKPHGIIDAVNFANDDEGLQRCCYVRFRHLSAARRASESIIKTPLAFDDHLTTSALVPRAPSADGRTLYFKGFYNSAGRLRQAFGEQFQDIKRVKILYDSRTAKHTGNGIIEFGSDESAARALEEMNGRDVNGRTLVLRPYTPSRAVTEAPNP